MDPQLGLKTVAEGSELLVTWALAVTGGTVAIILSTSYIRPSSPRIRRIYLLFIPGWLCMGFSAYFGDRVLRRLMAAQLVKHENLHAIGARMNIDFANQRLAFQIGLLFFSIWLVVFLVWWIFGEWSVAKPATEE